MNCAVVIQMKGRSKRAGCVAEKPLTKHRVHSGERIYSWLFQIASVSRETALCWADCVGSQGYYAEYCMLSGDEGEPQRLCVLQPGLVPGERRGRLQEITGLYPTQSTAQCWWLLVTAGDCWWLLVTAGDCWWLLVTAGDCWWLLVTAGDCWWLLVIAWYWQVVTAGDCWWLLVTAGDSLILTCGITAGDCWRLLVTVGDCWWQPDTDCWWLLVTAGNCWWLLVTAGDWWLLVTTWYWHMVTDGDCW